MCRSQGKDDSAIRLWRSADGEEEDEGEHDAADDDNDDVADDAADGADDEGDDEGGLGDGLAVDFLHCISFCFFIFKN